MTHSDEASREQLFGRLETLYQQLGQALPSASGNPCGRCRECCTGTGLSVHNVTTLEIDLIAARVGPEHVSEFRRFTERDGTIEVCPYFDDDLWGCGIYQHRPYSCRVFGHHRSQSTVLPEVCVFAGQEAIFGVGEYYQAVPLAVELRKLVRDYWPYTQQPEIAPSALNGVPLPNGPASTIAGDALDRALTLQSQGRYQEALQEMEECSERETPYFLYCQSLVFEVLGRHAEAAQNLARALSLVPRCVPLWFRYACNLYSLEQWEAAEAAFRTTLDLRPEHATAHGLLGGHYLRQGQAEAAIHHLAEALRLEPEQAGFRRLLDYAQSQLAVPSDQHPPG